MKQAQHTMDKGETIMLTRHLDFAQNLMCIPSKLTECVYSKMNNELEAINT